MKVGIVGGGIAGLTLGNALLKHAPEVDFQIFERTPVSRPAGAGLILAPNALHLLDGLGLYQPLRDHGQFLAFNQLCDQQGRVMQRIPGPADRFLAFHRAELSSLLQAGLQARLQHGKTYQGHHHTSSGIEVLFQDGTTATCDLLVGADGLRSRVRQQIGGPAPVYSGYTSWRTVLPDAPVLPGASELWGHGKRLGLVPLTQGRVYLYFTLNTPEGQAPLQQGTDLKSLFAEFAGADHGLLDRLHPDTPLIHTDIHELSRPCWGQQNVVLIGDAAHALTPNLGQGAGMGIEDGVLLARLLAEKPTVQEVTRLLNQRRNRRVEQVLLASRWIGRLGQLQNPTLVGLRNRLMVSGPSGGTPDWLWTPPA